MFPILFEIHGYKVHSYGFFYALGYLISLSCVIYFGKKSKLPIGKLIDLTFYSLLFGIVGARLLFVLTQLDYFKKNTSEIFYIWQGGAVFWGGFLFAILFIFFYIKLTKLPLWKTLDVLAISLPLGHAVGRIACLGAGCCHGKFCTYPWAIVLRSDLVDPALRGVPVHPTQIYEALGLIILFFLLLFIYRRKHFEGEIALLYLLGYSSLRYLVEEFRGDTIRGFVFSNRLSTSQFICLIVILFSLPIYIRKTYRFFRG